MEDATRKKLLAAGKMAMGAARMTSAVATGTGCGLVGAVCKQQHLMPVARRLAVHGFKGGKAQFEEGIQDWRRAGS